MELSELKTKLDAAGQSDLARHLGTRDAAGQAKLAAQLSALNLDALPALLRDYVRSKPQFPLPRDIQPVQAYPYRAATPEQEALYARAKARGHELLKQGKVGAFLVAGGQGTRLGYDGPKGEYPVTPIKNKPLFRVFAEQLLA
ncbi:MAG TPA: hypothetical protein VK986_14240, partial [Tepidisphaeraceae bacterium]|nr:hypothetical protein [Tepidisphaeraceae bacterium]